jgi:hypothetical protein
MSHLSTTLLDAAKAVPQAKRYSRNKVWLSDVHSAYCRLAESRITFARWSQSIVADADCRMLLARCDMPFTDREMCDVSDVLYMTSSTYELATFNFVKLPSANEVSQIESDIQACLLDSSACSALRSSLSE